MRCSGPLTGSSEPIASSPATTGTFVDGVWTGDVTIHEGTSDDVFIRVDDGAGHWGESNSFYVEGSGTPDCDDGVSCTIDVWNDTLEVCENTPDDSLCDDEQYCNGVEWCDAVADCQSGTPVVCNDGNPCTDDFCDDSSSSCVTVDNNAPCNDGDLCTGGDLCVEGVCVGQVDLCPENGEIFFDDFSDGLGQWTESGEGDWNTEPLHSSYQYPGSGSGSPAAHADSCYSECTIELSQGIDLTPFSGATLEFLRFVDVGLDIGEYLRVDLWNGSSWVTLFNWTNGSGDDDQWHAESVDLEDYLSVSDFSVRFVTRESYFTEHVHVDDVRIIIAAPLCEIDDDCDDSSVCTGTESCVAGDCIPGTPLDCDDDDVCTTDTCDPVLGCAYEDNSDPCDDGDACTVSDLCVAGSCQSGAPLDCDDSNVCTDDSCDPASGCVYVNNTAPCDDGDACTGDDQCTGGICVGPVDLCPEPEEIFLDTFDDGLSNWSETGEGDWNTELLHSSSGYPSNGSGSPAAHADNCDSVCTIELASLDLSGYSQAQLEFARFVDSSLESDDNLIVEIFNGSTWVVLFYWSGGNGDDNTWHQETVDLTGYLNPSFSIRFITTMDSIFEHVHIDDVRILAL